MQTDVTFIRHKFDKDLTIYPISDVHLGALEHQQKEWERFCKSVLDNPNAYITLGGDLINNATRSSVSNIFEEVMRPREQKNRMVEYLEPIKDRILCAVEGNHERRSGKDADDSPMYDIMAKLDIEHLYRENMAFIVIGLGDRKDGHGNSEYRRPNTQYIFAVTHGAGGGAFTGAGVNRNERFGNVIEGVDCLITGHTHKGTVTKPSKIVVDARQDTALIRSYTVITSVSWMNYGGYAMQKMLLPADACNPQRIAIYKNNKRIEVNW